MIAFLTGRLLRKAADHLIVDVSGVGYQVSVPLSTLQNLPDDDGVVGLHIHTHLREDSLSLYGFLTEAEKEMFLLLLGVSGIGPKLALAVLSNISVEDLSGAILAADDSKLRTISGIGKKTAARMVLELKDKIKLIGDIAATSGRTETVAFSELLEDAISALVNLGYKKQLAEDTLKRVQQGKPGLSVEMMIREALSILMKR